MGKIIFFLLFSCFFVPNLIYGKYAANWSSLDTRPLPGWYDQAKIGIFIHWGVFSVPSFGSEWFWSFWKWGLDGEPDFVKYSDYIQKNYPPGFSYQEFAKDFTAEFFNPTDWATLFKKSGAKYVVLTSKHHEGFTLWPSKYSFSWNAMDVGPHRDLIDELSTAVRKAGLDFGLYHSLLEWYNPQYLEAANSNFKDKTFVNKTFGELYELVNNYKPSVIWSDGDWECNGDFWEAEKFISWLYNESPVKDRVVVNDRWGADITCNHGDFLTCEDRFQPGALQPKKWENAMTIDKSSWGFRRNAKLDEYLTIEELLETVVQTIAYGGNILINVGPTKDGIIEPIFEERLTQLGEFLDVNGEAIYSTNPWKVSQNDAIDKNVYYTQQAEAIYAIFLDWPQDNLVKLGSAGSLFLSTNTTVQLLGNSGDLKWSENKDEISIILPDKATVKNKHAWVLKILA